MAEQRRQLTVGLFKKHEDNKIEDYIDLVPDATTMGLGTVVGNEIEEMVELKLKQMQENP